MPKPNIGCGVLEEERLVLLILGIHDDVIASVERSRGSHPSFGIRGCARCLVYEKCLSRGIAAMCRRR
jgi:hypothetical protein